MPEADDVQTLESRIARLEALLHAVLQPTFAELSRELSNTPGVHAEFHEFRTSARALLQDNKALRVLIEAIQSRVQTQRRVQAMGWRLESEIANIRRLLNEHLYALSWGLDLDRLSLQRVLPARIYVSRVPRGRIRKNAHEQILHVFDTLLAAFGLKRDSSVSFGPSPFFAHHFAYIYGFTRSEMEEYFALIGHALEWAFTGREQQPGINEKQADAASALYNTFRRTGDSTVQIGSVLLLRYRDTLRHFQTVIWRLTPGEMMLIEQNSQLLHNPPRLLLHLVGNQEGPAR